MDCWRTGRTTPARRPTNGRHRASPKGRRYRVPGPARHRGRPQDHRGADQGALELVAKRNEIKATVITNWRAHESPDRRAHEPQGPFIELAKAFEQLLPRYMRTDDDNLDALAQRLQRARKK